MRMFRNDYSEGAAPEVLQALIDTNEEQCPGYTEGDVHCERARALIREAVGLPDAAVEFCAGGTSVNLIAIAGMLRDWEGVIATPLAHIATHETGAVAAAGRTILLTDDADGFVSPDAAERVWERQCAGGRHMTKPALIYIADTTEIGGVWSRERFFALADWADAHDIPIYVDGARLASALEARDADLALEDIAKRAAAFTLGGTKDGGFWASSSSAPSRRTKMETCPGSAMHARRTGAQSGSSKVCPHLASSPSADMTRTSSSSM